MTALLALAALLVVAVAAGVWALVASRWERHAEREWAATCAAPSRLHPYGESRD